MEDRLGIGLWLLALIYFAMLVLVPRMLIPLRARVALVFTFVSSGIAVTGLGQAILLGGIGAFGIDSAAFSLAFIVLQGFGLLAFFLSTVGYYYHRSRHERQTTEQKLLKAERERAELSEKLDRIERNQHLAAGAATEAGTQSSRIEQGQSDHREVSDRIEKKLEDDREERKKDE